MGSRGKSGGNLPAREKTERAGQYSSQAFSVTNCPYILVLRTVRVGHRHPEATKSSKVLAVREPADLGQYSETPSTSGTYAPLLVLAQAGVRSACRSLQPLTPMATY